MKIGDHVKYNGSQDQESPRDDIAVGLEGVVTEVWPGVPYPYIVEFADGKAHVMAAHELEFVNEA